MGTEPQPQKPTVTAFLRGADGQVLPPRETGPAGATFHVEFLLPPVPPEALKDPEVLRAYKAAVVKRVREVVLTANQLHLAKGGGGLRLNSAFIKLPKPSQPE